MIKRFSKRARLMQQVDHGVDQARRSALASKAGFSIAGDQLSQWLIQPAGLVSALGTGMAIGWHSDNTPDEHIESRSESEQLSDGHGQSRKESDQMFVEPPASPQCDCSENEDSFSREIAVKVLSRVASAWLASLIVEEHSST